MTVFETFYRAQQRPPWDLDGPTPFVVELESAGAFTGVVLDAGCGTGENALYLGARGDQVVGMDAAPTAIARARAKAASRHVPSVTFVEADACEIPGYSDAFDSVLDCGFFHVLSPEDQARYVAALTRATRGNAVFHLMAFSDRNPPVRRERPTGCFTHGVSEGELREAFSPEWTVDSLAEAANLLESPGAAPREVYFWQARLTKSGVVLP